MFHETKGPLEMGKGLFIKKIIGLIEVFENKVSFFELCDFIFEIFCFEGLWVKILEFLKMEEEELLLFLILLLLRRGCLPLGVETIPLAEGKREGGNIHMGISIKKGEMFSLTKESVGVELSLNNEEVFF
jgi:hypothetical protein